MGGAEEAPVDPFRQSQLNEAQEPHASRSREIAEGKEYNELALGGSRRNAKLQQYLENDRKVLSFKCYWDDPTRYGARMYYTLHYYLADDTVEMLDSLVRNSGRDPYPVFWRRSPLRKNPQVIPAPGMLEPESIICKPEDFIVGQTVQVYGRDIYLYDCDDFTRDFYRKYMDFEQDSQEIRQDPPTHVQLTYPPHTGFGSDEDSLANCLRLTPRPPRRDINKLMLDADKIMRFQASMVTDKAEDINRKFIVAIYPADNGVSVWECKSRNSGHAEGKFAERSRKQNPDTGTWFQPLDFQVGSVVTVNSTPFTLTDADEGTYNYMEQNCKDFPVADVNLILRKVSKLQGDFANRETPCISFEQFRSVASAGGVELTQHECATLARSFGQMPSSESPGHIDVEKLCARLSM